MTTCVAVRDAKRGGWHIASDSRGTYSSEVVIDSPDPKYWVQQKDIGLVFAWAGEWGPALAVKHRLPKLEIPEGMSVEAFVSITVTDEIRKVVKSVGLEKRLNECNAIIICRGEVFLLEGIGDLSPISTDYVAVGSGATCAYGAMYATFGDHKEADVAKLGAEAGVKFDAYSGGPVTVSFIKDPK